MQVKVNYVDAHVTGSSDSDQRIHVGAVHVDEAAGVMDDLTNLLDVSFKQPERVGVRQHKPGDVTVAHSSRKWSGRLSLPRSIELF